MATRCGPKKKSPALRLGPVLCLLTLAGCEDLMGRSSFDGDPLSGGGAAIPRAAAPNNQATGVAGAPAAAPSPAGAIPSAPVIPAATTSPAALSSGAANSSLDPSRDLRIGTGLGSPAPVTPTNFAPTADGPSPAVLRSPQPASDNGFQQPGSMQPPLAAGSPAPPRPVGSTADTYQQLQDALNRRGVTWRRLETISDTNEWRFTCAVPNATNANVRHTFSVTAGSDLAAIRAVLDQIDRDAAQKH